MLQDYKAEGERCSQCSYCKWIPLDHIKSQRFSKGCPGAAYSGFLSYSARGKYAVTLSLLRGENEYTDTVLDIANKCMTCGLCDVSCKVCRYNLEPLEMIRELRAKLVSDGYSLPQHRAIVDSLIENHNSMKQPGAGRGDWAAGLDVKDLTVENGEVLFHTGCRLSYDKELWDVTRTAVSVLKDAGVDIGILGKDEMCCGGRIYDIGYRREYAEIAQKNIAAWTRASVKTIVTSCSHCYHAFKRLYPQNGSGFEVLHTVELVDRLIKSGQIKFTKPVPMVVTYHDPCHLGRQGEPYVPWQGAEKKIRNQIVIYDPPRPRYNGAFGVYRPPREILTSIPGIEMREMERTREYSWCCGAGAGVREAYPDFSNWTARERIEEASATGAGAIVSACPWCETQFTDAVGGGQMRVFDIIELVKKAM